MSEPRSPIQRRRTQMAREHVTREDKIYREVMGFDGKVKPQYEQWLLALEIDADDLLDK